MERLPFQVIPNNWIFLLLNISIQHGMHHLQKRLIQAVNQLIYFSFKFGPCHNLCFNYSSIKVTHFDKKSHLPSDIFRF